MSHSEALFERARTITKAVAMVDTCVITTPGAPVKDGAGGTTVGDPTYVTTPCRLREAGAGTEQTIADRAGFQQPMAIDLPIDVVVSPSATIEVDGRVFEIGGVSRAGAWARKQTLIVRQNG